MVIFQKYIKCPLGAASLHNDHISKLRFSHWWVYDKLSLIILALLAARFLPDPLFVCHRGLQGELESLLHVQVLPVLQALGQLREDLVHVAAVGGAGLAEEAALVLLGKAETFVFAHFSGKQRECDSEMQAHAAGDTSRKGICFQFSPNLF